MNPAHSGATALVPPMGSDSPSTITAYPVAGSASPETSGTPLPTRPPGLEDGGTLELVCQVGRSKTSLIPPPVAPPFGLSFHTISLVIETPFPELRVVPPHPSA